MIARLSALAFLGPKFCRNQDWIDVSVNYTLDVFNAARILNLWSAILRPIVVWFLPETRKLRTHLRKARGIIEPEMAERAQQRQQDANSDVNHSSNNDALEWFRESSEAAKKPLDITLSQICLSIAAIHITSQLLINVMYDLAAYPQYIEILREELLQVLEEDRGWKSTTPAKLKRMDSVVKESQRMNPSSMSRCYLITC
jgi:cytochrome P450